MKARLHITAITLFVLGSLMSASAQSVHWKKMNEPIVQTPNSIQRIGKYLIMTTLQSSFLVSDDDGKSWIERFNLKESSILPQNTIGSSLCFDSTANIVVSDGGFYLTRLLSSTDLGVSWSPLHSTVFHSMTIRSFCKWDSGFVVCGNNSSDDSHIVHVIDTFSKRRQKITKHFFTVFALDKILAIGDSGIYRSRKDSVDFKKILDFSSIGDTVTFNYGSGLVYVTSGKYIYTSDDKGNSWRNDSVPFIIKHFKKSKKHFYAVDEKKRLWKADINERKWGVLLHSISNRRDITCMYADDDLMIFGVKYEGIRRYSLKFDKWINEDVQIPLVTPYSVRVKDMEIYSFPLYASSTLYSGYCGSTDLGDTWKICHITPYGMMYARISDNTKYYQGVFHDFDWGYNTCYAFSEYVGLGIDIPMVLPERNSSCIYTFVLKDKIMSLSTKLDSITLSKNKLVLLKHKTNFPFESISDLYGNPTVDIYLIADTVLCQDNSNDSNCYYSTDYGKNWFSYHNWRSGYGKGVDIIHVGENSLRIEKNGLIMAWNRTTQSWVTIHDTLSNMGNIYDYDFNDSLFVMSNNQGIFYITPDDLSEITSVGDEDEENMVFSVLSGVFSDKLKIVCKNNDNTYAVKIYSMLGQEIMSLANLNNTSYELDVRNLKNGIYFIQVQLGNFSYIKKILKM